MSTFLEKVYSRLNINVNMSIEIEEKIKDKVHRYKSFILEYLPNNNSAKVGMPLYKGAYVKIPHMTKIKLRVFTQKAVYLFNSEVKSYGKEGNIRYLVIDVPDVIIRVQRRIHVRVPIVEEGFFYKKTEFEQNEENIDTLKKYRFISKDFSAGGIAIVSKEKLNINDILLLNIKIKDETNLENFEAKVVRKIGETDFREGIYGLDFVNIDNKTEKEFVKLVFKLEIESSKKNRRI